MFLHLICSSAPASPRGRGQRSGAAGEEEGQPKAAGGAEDADQAAGGGAAATAQGGGAAAARPLTHPVRDETRNRRATRRRRSYMMSVFTARPGVMDSSGEPLAAGEEDRKSVV